MLDLSDAKRKKCKAGLTYNSKEARFVITFDQDISKAEFLESWARFEKARKKITGRAHFTRRRQPNNLQLLLGVQCFRGFGVTFNSIHEVYSKKQVPYYNGEYKFLTEFDLAKYYNRNIKKIKGT